MVRKQACRQTDALAMATAARVVDCFIYAGQTDRADVGGSRLQLDRMTMRSNLFVTILFAANVILHRDLSLPLSPLSPPLSLSLSLFSSRFFFFTRQRNRSAMRKFLSSRFAEFIRHDFRRIRSLGSSGGASS